jgi:hypothetical protein
LGSLQHSANTHLRLREQVEAAPTWMRRTVMQFFVSLGAQRNQRTGPPNASAPVPAAVSAVAIAAIERGLRAVPNNETAPLASHWAISALRTKLLSAHGRMRNFGQRAPIRRMMRAISSAALAEASIFERRSLVNRRSRLGNTWSGRQQR